MLIIAYIIYKILSLNNNWDLIILDTTNLNIISVSYNFLAHKGLIILNNPNLIGTIKWNTLEIVNFKTFSKVIGFQEAKIN